MLSNQKKLQIEALGSNTFEANNKPKLLSRAPCWGTYIVICKTQFQSILDPHQQHTLSLYKPKDRRAQITLNNYLSTNIKTEERDEPPSAPVP